MKRAERPRRGPLDQIRTQGVPLDVSTNGKKVGVIADRKTLEATLVEMPSAEVVVMRPISKGVCASHPAEQSSHLAIFGGSKHQMPVVRHQCVGKQFDRVFRQAFGENPFEGLEILLFVKDRLPLITAIQGVIDLAGLVIAWLPGHQTLRWCKLGQSFKIPKESTENYPRHVFFSRPKTTPVTFSS